MIKKYFDYLNDMCGEDHLVKYLIAFVQIGGAFLIISLLIQLVIIKYG